MPGRKHVLYKCYVPNSALNNQSLWYGNIFSPESPYMGSAATGFIMLAERKHEVNLRYFYREYHVCLQMVGTRQFWKGGRI